MACCSSTLISRRSCACSLHFSGGASGGGGGDAVDAAISSCCFWVIGWAKGLCSRGLCVKPEAGSGLGGVVLGGAPNAAVCAFGVLAVEAATTAPVAVAGRL
jgi:hypothetical protein